MECTWTDPLICGCETHCVVLSARARIGLLYHLTVKNKKSSCEVAGNDVGISMTTQQDLHLEVLIFFWPGTVWACTSHLPTQQGLLINGRVE